MRDQPKGDERIYGPLQARVTHLRRDSGNLWRRDAKDTTNGRTHSTIATAPRRRVGYVKRREGRLPEFRQNDASIATVAKKSERREQRVPKITSLMPW